MRLLGWWYVCIAVGFLLLGLHRLLIGEPQWLVILRWIVALGFLILAYFVLKKVK